MMKLNIGKPNDTKLLIAALVLMLTSGLTIITGPTPTVGQSKKAILGVTLASTSSTPYSCSDTDNGDKPATKGTITVTENSSGLTSSYTDSCITSSTVSEFICSSTTSTDPGYRFLIEACYGGYCQDGACVTATSTPIISPGCYDSDGNNTNTKGNVTVTSTAGIATYFDSCVSSSVVQEFICTATSSFASKNIPCAGGKFCSDGSCQFPTSTVSLLPSLSAPINAVVASTNTLINRFILSTNGKAPVILRSVTLSAKTENAWLSAPALFIGAKKLAVGSGSVQTSGTIRIYKITFSNVNTPLTENGQTEFKITASIKKQSEPIGQQAQLQISFLANSIIWKNTASGQISNSVLGLPWTSKKLIIQ